MERHLFYRRILSQTQTPAPRTIMQERVRVMVVQTAGCVNTDGQPLLVWFRFGTKLKDSHCQVGVRMGRQGFRLAEVNLGPCYQMSVWI